MTPAELAAELDVYIRAHAADARLWTVLLPEAARMLRESATAVAAEREACAKVCGGLRDGDETDDYDAGWEHGLLSGEIAIKART